MPDSEALLGQAEEALHQRLLRQTPPAGVGAPALPGGAAGPAGGNGQGAAPAAAHAGVRIMRLPDPSVSAAPEQTPSAGERFAAAAAPNMGDQLATIEKLYPGSHPYVEQSGGLFITPEDLARNPHLESRIARGIDRNTGEVHAYLPEQRRIVYTDPKTGQKRQWNPAGLDWGDAAELVPPVLQGAGYAAGAAGGAALATAAGNPEAAPAAAVAAGTLGERIAAAAVHLAARFFGTQDSRSVAQIAKDQIEPVLTDVLTGAATEYGGRVARGAKEQATAEKMAGTLRPEETARPGSLEALKTMGRETVGDENAALGGGAVLANKAPSLAQKIDALGQNPRSSNLVAKATERTHEIVSKYADQALDATGSAATTRAEAGAGLGPDLLRAKSAADLAVRHTNLQIMERLQAANPDNPDLWAGVPRLRAALNDVDAEALGLSHAKGLLVPKEFSNLQADLEAANNGRLPLRTALNVLTELGDKGGAVALIPGQRAQSLAQHLYGALREDIASGLDEMDIGQGVFQGKPGGASPATAGMGARDLFEKRQADYAAWAQRRERLGFVERAASPEAAFTQAFAGSKGGASLLKDLKDTVSPDTFNDLTRRKLMELGWDKAGQGDFNALQLSKRWGELADDTKDVLAPVGSDLRKSLDNLSELGDNWRAFEQLRNKSRTSGGIEAQKSIKAGVMELLLSPLQGAKSALGLTPEARAALVMDPRFSEWLVKGGKIKPGDNAGMALHIGRLSAIATAQHLEPQISAYLAELRAQGRPILSSGNAGGKGGAGNEGKP